MQVRGLIVSIGFAATLACSGLAGGCTGFMPLSQSSALVSSKVKIGMSRGDAVGHLGSPQRTEMIGATEFLFYTPAWYVSPLLVTSQNPIAIRDAKVVGIGQSYYDTVAQDANKLGTSN